MSICTIVLNGETFRVDHKGNEDNLGRGFDPYEISEGMIEVYCYKNHLHKDRYFVATDEAQAVKATRHYFEDLIENDPYEFLDCLTGSIDQGIEVLLSWCRGQTASPLGYEAKSLGEWLDIASAHSAREWGRSDDSTIRDVEFSPALEALFRKEFGWDNFDNVVAYKE